MVNIYKRNVWCRNSLSLFRVLTFHEMYGPGMHYPKSRLHCRCQSHAALSCYFSDILLFLIVCIFLPIKNSLLYDGAGVNDRKKQSVDFLKKTAEKIDFFFCRSHLHHRSPRILGDTHIVPGGGGGGGALRYRGGRTRVTYFAEEGVFF